MAILLDKVRRIWLKRPRLIAEFLDETGHTYTRNVKYENNRFTLKMWGKKDTEYIVDQKFNLVDRRSGLPKAYYYEGDPQPRWMQHERTKKDDAIGLHKIIESKIVEDLFKEDQADKIFWLLVLGIVNILISIVVVLVLFKVIKVA